MRPKREEKTMRLLPLVPLLALWACSEEKAAAPAPAASVAPPAAAASAKVQPDSRARTVKVSNDLYEFEFSYPAQAAAIPALKAMLDTDAIQQQAELRNEAQEEAADAKVNDYPFHPHSRSYNWQVVTETPGWLSLSSLVGAYTGGAHPNYWFSAILWDRTAGKARKATDLFTSKQALSAAIRKPFCAELNRQRARKRRAPVDPASTDMFNECIDPVAETVILGSSNGQVFNRIGILVPPYEAGAYAEGDYEVTLPVTPAVLAAVKSEYQASFAMK
jgi:hypothetical protein